jgi:hypothetical protein
LPNLSGERSTKEVNVMEIATSFLAALLLAGRLGVGSALAAADGVISNEVIIPGVYCHLTFPAIRDETLTWVRPVLKEPSAGDIINFYGSCEHDPLGKEEIESQKNQSTRQRSRPG